MTKQDRETLIFDIIDSCKDKTIKEMREQLNGDELHDSVVNTMIQQRTSELEYSDGTGAVYL